MNRSLALPLALLSMTACASLGSFRAHGGLRPSDAERIALEADFVGRSFVLVSSLYTGPFFGDAERHYADLRHPDLIALQHHRGATLPRPEMSGPFIAARTKVRVRALHFPPRFFESILDPRTSAMPTAHPWIELETASTASKHPSLVVALPRDVTTIDEFRARAGEIMLAPAEAERWFAELDERMRRNIRDKRVVAGMSRAEVQAALGPPRAIEGEDAIAYTADYGDVKVVFSGQLVSAVIEPGKQQEPAAQPEPSVDPAALIAALAGRSAQVDSASSATETRVAEAPAAEPSRKKVKPSSNKRKKASKQARKHRKGRR